MKSNKQQLDPIMVKRQACRTFAELRACMKQIYREQRPGFIGLMLAIVMLTTLAGAWTPTAVVALRGALGIVLALAATYLILFCMALRSPSRAVHNWALEEKEKQEILALQGNTPEELERMLQWHLNQGNIAEADRISQKLLSVVDRDGLDALAAAGSGGPAEPSGSGLPGWLRNDKLEEQPEQSNLPDWIKS